MTQEELMPMTQEELIARIIDLKEAEDTPAETLGALRFLDGVKSREEARNRIIQQLNDKDGDKGWLRAATAAITEQENPGKGRYSKGYVGYNENSLNPSESLRQRPISPEDLDISSIHKYEDKFFPIYLINNEFADDGRDARDRLYEIRKRRGHTGRMIEMKNILNATAGLKSHFDRLGNLIFEPDEEMTYKNEDGTEDSRFADFKEAMGFPKKASAQDVGDFMLGVFDRGMVAHKWSTEGKPLTDALPLIAAGLVAPQVVETLQEGKEPTKADIAADFALGALAAVPGGAMAKAGYMPLLRGAAPARLAKDAGILKKMEEVAKREFPLASKSALGGAAITAMQEGVDYAHDVVDDIFGPEIRYSFTYDNPVGEERPEESTHEEEFGKRHKNPFKANLHPIDRTLETASALLYGGVSTPMVRALPWLRHRRIGSMELPSLKRHLEETEAFRDKMRKAEEVNFKRGNFPLYVKGIQKDYDKLTSRIDELRKEQKDKFGGRGRAQLDYEDKYEDVPTRKGKFKRVKKRKLNEKDEPLKKLLDEIDEQWDLIAKFEDKYGRNMDSWPKKKLWDLAKLFDSAKNTKGGKVAKGIANWAVNYARMQALKGGTSAIPKLKEALMKWNEELNEDE